MTPVSVAAGFVVTVVIAFFVTPLLNTVDRKFRCEGTQDLAPMGPGARWLGFFEAVIFFSSFVVADLKGVALAGAWLVFKSAAKWKAWDSVLEKEHRSISARYRLFLLGTAANIVAGLAGAATVYAIPQIGWITTILRCAGLSQ